VNTAVVFAVAGAGAFGATSRYLMTVWLRSLWGESPWPIATVNVLGCFGFGVCWSLAQGRMSHPVAIAVLVGFFGAFTTFSAFALDGQLLLAERKFGLFAINLMVQNGMGVLALWLGMLASGTRS
jgi:CrcB protein